jgi:2-iminobutanoate/2-iminopropanoate deaminase
MFMAKDASQKIFVSKSAPAPIGPYSQAVEAGGFLFCSGQIPLDPQTGQLVTGSIADQTAQVMKNIEAVLTAADLTFASVVKTTIFLHEMDDFAVVNEVYGQHFKADPPARSTVSVKGLPKGARVEIEVVARR